MDEFKFSENIKETILVLNKPISHLIKENWHVFYFKQKDARVQLNADKKARILSRGHTQVTVSFWKAWWNSVWVFDAPPCPLV